MLLVSLEPLSFGNRKNTRYHHIFFLCRSHRRLSSTHYLTSEWPKNSYINTHTYLQMTYSRNRRKQSCPFVFVRGSTSSQRYICIVQVDRLHRAKGPPVSEQLAPSRLHYTTPSAAAGFCEVLLAPCLKRAARFTSPTYATIDYQGYVILRILRVFHVQ